MIKWLLKKIFSIVIFVGIALIISGFFANQSLTSFLEKAMPSTAIITEIEGERFLTGEPNVHVEYVIDGKDYENKLKYYEETMTEGATVDILYNPEFPRNMRAAAAENPSKSLYKWGGILAVGGIVLSILRSVAEKRRIQRRADRKAEKKYSKMYGEYDD